MKLQEMTELRQFAVKVFVYCVKALLQLLLRQLAHWVVRGVVVDVGKQNRLRKRRFDVFSRAPVAVAASANLWGESLSESRTA